MRLLRPNGPPGEELKSRRRKALEEKELLEELRENAKTERGDIFALIIAGLTTIAPVAIVLVLLYFLLSMLFFG